MSHPDPAIRILAEATDHGGPAQDWVHACARAASQAGADAVRVPRLAGLAGEAPEAWTELRRSVLRLDVDLLVTVASVEDVEFIRGVGVGGLAVSTSPEGGAEPVWEAVGKAHLPVVVLSDPLTDLGLGAALSVLERYDIEITVLFGSPERPVPAEHLGLSRVTAPSPGSRVALGFSDRSGTGWPALAACALGASVVELPLSLSPYLPGSEGALSPDALRRTVEGLRYLAWARAHEAPR